MIKNKPIANIVLAIMTGLFLLCYPLRENWWYALGMHIFGAAMIGGLADWYAVTALFAKPLGISYKTALIPKARERIITLAREMVTEELLTVPHIYKVVKDEKFFEILIIYLLSSEGKKQTHAFIEEISTQITPHFDTSSAGQELIKLIEKGVENWSVTPFLLDLGQTVLTSDSLEIIWRRINKGLQNFIASDFLRPYLLTLVENMLLEYKRDSMGREIALAVADSFISSEEIVAAIQRKSLEYLAAQQSLTSTLGRFFKGSVQDLLQEFSSREDWREQIEAKKLSWFRLQVATEGSFIKRVEGKLNLSDFLQQGEYWLHAYLQGLLANEANRKPLEKIFLLRLLPLLEQVRPIADRMVTQKLEAYTASEMTRALKDKVYYDLQMVRINGSFVGAVLGGLFFLGYSVVKAVIL